MPDGTMIIELVDRTPGGQGPPAPPPAFTAATLPPMPPPVVTMPSSTVTPLPFPNQPGEAQPRPASAQGPPPVLPSISEPINFEMPPMPPVRTMTQGQGQETLQQPISVASVQMVEVVGPSPLPVTIVGGQGGNQPPAKPQLKEGETGLPQTQFERIKEGLTNKVRGLQDTFGGLGTAFKAAGAALLAAVQTYLFVKDQEIKQIRANTRDFQELMKANMVGRQINKLEREAELIRDTSRFAGSTSGMIAGGAIGGAIGSVIPGVGTAAGIVVGGTIGKIAGETIGRVVGDLLVKNKEKEIELLKAFLAKEQAVVDKAKAISDVSGDVQAATAVANVRKIIGDIREAQQLGTVAARAIDAQSRRIDTERRVLMDEQKREMEKEVRENEIRVGFLEFVATLKKDSEERKAAEEAYQKSLKGEFGDMKVILRDKVGKTLEDIRRQGETDIEGAVDQLWDDIFNDMSAQHIPDSLAGQLFQRGRARRGVNRPAFGIR